MINNMVSAVSFLVFMVIYWHELPYSSLSDTGLVLTIIVWIFYFIYNKTNADKILVFIPILISIAILFLGVLGNMS